MTDEVLDSFQHPDLAGRLRDRMIQRARGKFGISADEAEDVVQNALTVYLEVHHRYTHVGNPSAILFGIFHKKCLEHVDQSVREKRKLRRYCESPDAARSNPWIRPDMPAQTGSVLQQVIRDEEGRKILGAVKRLRPKSGEIARLVVEQSVGRRELVSMLGINANTVDSRLHDCRMELRKILSRDGIAI